MKKSNAVALGVVAGIITGVPMYYIGKTVKCYMRKVKARTGSMLNIDSISKEEKEALQEEAIYEAMPFLRGMEK